VSVIRDCLFCIVRWQRELGTATKKKRPRHTIDPMIDSDAQALIDIWKPAVRALALAPAASAAAPAAGDEEENESEGTTDSEGDPKPKKKRAKREAAASSSSSSSSSSASAASSASSAELKFPGLSLAFKHLIPWPCD
jgi:hypothetical protein